MAWGGLSDAALASGVAAQRRRGAFNQAAVTAVASAGTPAAWAPVGSRQTSAVRNIAAMHRVSHCATATRAILRRLALAALQSFKA